MQYTEFIHPEDAAALKALKAIPMLSTIVKKVMDVGTEQLQTGLNMASKVKLSPTQLPRLYNILPPICERLEIKVPSQSPQNSILKKWQSKPTFMMLSARMDFGIKHCRPTQ